MEKNAKKNNEGYYDLTAYHAINHVEKGEYERRNKLLHTIFHICELAGFELQGHVMLKDRQTGRIWR